MARQDFPRGEPDVTAGRIERRAGVPADPACSPAPPASHLARLAELVADGEAEFPTQVSEAEAEQLRRSIRRRLRDRLIRYLARQIAVDLHAASSNTEST